MPRSGSNKVGPAPTPLHMAIKHGRHAIAELLIQADGIDVNAGNPLLVAVEKGDIAMYELLIKAKVRSGRVVGGNSNRWLVC